MKASNGTTVRTRAALLAGASLAAATVLGAGVLVMPSVALAANECGDPTANGASNDTFACAGTYSGISYPATSGNLTLQLQSSMVVSSGGIVVTPSGSNAVTISRVDPTLWAGDPEITNTAGAGISIIRAAPNNGNFTVNLTDPDFEGDEAMSITGTTAGIYLSNSGSGSQTLTTTNGTITATAGVGVRLGTVGTGNITFSNGSTVSGTTGGVLVAEGVNATISNFGTILGSVNFNNTGASTFNNQGYWRAGGVMNLGTGSSTLTNLHTIIVDGTLTFTGLETFNFRDPLDLNGTPTPDASRIIFGAGEGLDSTDGAADDRFVPGTNLNLIDNVTLVLDVAAGGAEQASCAAAVSADCLDLRGFTFGGEGSVLVQLNAAPGAGTTVAERIVIVDAAGGSVSESRFMLSPSSGGYMEGADGATGIDLGALSYTLNVDEAGDQVYLTAGPGSSSARYAQLADAAEAAWDASVSTWFDRQVHLRQDGELGSGVWLRASQTDLDRISTQSVGPFNFDTSFEMAARVLTGGIDFAVAQGQDRSMVVGVMAGQIDAEVKQVGVEPKHELSGYSVGAYGAWLSGPFFLDGLVNYVHLDTSSEFLSEDGEATTFGAQLEGGYRYAISEHIAVQPLAALAYTSTDLSEGSPAGVPVEVDSVSSLRAALGIRFSGESELAGLTARFAFTGRAWQQFGGEIETAVGASGFTYDDERDTLGDVALTVSLAGLADRLSVHTSARLKFKDGYEAAELGLGVRYAF